MALRNVLRKKEKTQAPPEFKFIRSDTHTQEHIQPPSHDDDHHETKESGLFHRRQRPSSSHSHDGSRGHSETREKGDRRLSHRLHLGRSSRSASTSSVNLPSNLPPVDSNIKDEQEREAQWEKRATLLAHGEIQVKSAPNSPLRSTGRSPSPGVPRVNDPESDVNIQEAIRLHEAGELEKSTEMFRQLADLEGSNNALSQVLYGLALRHGWGCKPDPARAVTYLSAAASNSALIEEQALGAGMKKGGAAKGELVLAIYELANCFRHGWGVAKDPAAARQYYETAANLGDTDAMNEVAQCYLDGFGGKKDKYMAAKYFRLAEQAGNQTVSNSWIWKEKYNPK